jgi:hypothetical protein
MDKLTPAKFLLGRKPGAKNEVVTGGWNSNEDWDLAAVCCAAQAWACFNETPGLRRAAAAKL